MAAVTVVDAGGDHMLLTDVDGRRICTFDRKPVEQAELVRNIKHFNCRDDDVFIFAPVKSGTHWTWELASMLQKGRAETIPQSKSKHMLEHETSGKLDAIPSPRILNSHLHISQLPQQLFEKKCKIIYILRNPKDMLVSWYHHVKGLHCYGYDGKWDGFFQLFMNNELEYGSWIDYVTEWEQFTNDNHTHPVLLMFYEDLKKNCVKEIKRLAEFLGINADDKLVSAISEKCQFQNMHKDKMYPDDVRKVIFKGDFTMYRKGVIGDWKNWFTVAQSEQFDELLAKTMVDSKIHFVYS